MKLTDIIAIGTPLMFISGTSDDLVEVVSGCRPPSCFQEIRAPMGATTAAVAAAFGTKSGSQGHELLNRTYATQVPHALPVLSQFVMPGSKSGIPHSALLPEPRRLLS